MPGQTLSLSDAISGYQSGLKQHVDDTVKGEKAATDTYESKIGAANEEEANLDPNALKPPALTPAPTPEATEPMKVWGSAAMWMAALGGILTKRPLINSLNAAGAVVKAYRDQDAAAAQSAYDTWKVETENAVKMAQFSIDAYKTALSKIDSDKKEAAAEFTATAKALGDENAAYVATHYGVDAAVRYVDAMQAHNDRIKEQQPKIDQQNVQLQLGLKLVDAGKALRAAQQTGDQQKIAAATSAFRAAQEDAKGFNMGIGKGGGAAQGGDYTDDAIALAGTEYRLTGKMPALGMGNADARAKIINYAAEQAKQMGQSNEEVVALQAGVGSDTAALRNITRIGTASAAFENTAMKNFNKALELAKKGGIPTDLGPWVNKFIQTGETGAGNKDVPAYVAALLTGANEYAKVISGSTGSQGSTVDSRKEAANMFSGAYDYDTIRNVIYNVAKPDMENKKQSYNDMQRDLESAISSGTTKGTVVSGNEPFKPDPAWPAAKGVPDGKVLKDETGKVIARAKGGQWMAP